MAALAITKEEAIVPLFVPNCHEPETTFLVGQHSVAGIWSVETALVKNICFGNAKVPSVTLTYDPNLYLGGCIPVFINPYFCDASQQAISLTIDPNDFMRCTAGFLKPAVLIEAAPTRVSPSPESDEMDRLMDQVKVSVGTAKVQTQTRAANFMLGIGAPSTDVNRAIRRLLGERRSGRLDDAVDFLSLLGRNAVEVAAKDSLEAFPPSGLNVDHWYALIRAAGKTGNREIPETFAASQFVTLQEAAIEALADLGDATAIGELRRIAVDPTRLQFIRELAQELIADLA